MRAASASDEIFARDNLVAWCIVPFDAKERTPESRAEMLQRLGFKHYTYDWRAEHLPTFETELDELAKRRIELTGVWFPDQLNADARFILDALGKHNIKTQLWVTSGADNLDAADKIIRLIADAAGKIGCTVGLYNHGGWFGEPENQLAIIERLKLTNVGIVYNLHHGHEHLDRFGDVLRIIKPHLLCLNLNGMTKGGEKILPIGAGKEDERILRIIRDSGYRGRIGILNHTDLDAEQRLRENLEGLDRLVRWSIEDAGAREKLPLYQTTAAATIDELTPANGWPVASKQWPRSHGGDACMRYSPLEQITRANVKSLKVAWAYKSGDGAGNVQCNPIIVDGKLFGPTAGNHIVAIDAASGEELWRFKPYVVPTSMPPAKPAARGLTFHRGDDQTAQRLLFCADNALWALNPSDGKPIASFGSDGRITIPPCVVAPAVLEDTIIYAGWNGDVFGVDLRSGAPRWRFHTIPQAGEEFADTWNQPAEGANCWGGMALDASRGIVYVTTGSPKPNFHGNDHVGDNLFANCVIAIDARSGKRVWHFQEIRHDIWDLDLPAPPVLVTVTREGKRVDAVAAVTKIGNTLLLDRVTGKPLFPFRMRRAPASNLPGERTAAYQPDVELPEPFARSTFTLEDVTDISPAARRSVLAKLKETGAVFGFFRAFDDFKPVAMFGIHGGAEWTGAAFDPASGFLFVSSNEITWMPSVVRYIKPAIDETSLPPTAGRRVYEKNCMPCHGASREGLAMNPPLIGMSQRLGEAGVRKLLTTGRGTMPVAKLTGDDEKALLDYVFDRDHPQLAPTTRPHRPTYRFNGYPRLLDDENYPGNKPPWGTLSAINLNTGRIAWRAPLGEHDELTRRGIPKTGTENFGGPTVTAGGLVFCAGTRDLKIRAFDSATGEELWSHQLPFGGFAPPSVYEVNGKQYVVIAATGGGKLAVEPHPEPKQPVGDAYIAFSLP